MYEPYVNVSGAGNSAEEQEIMQTKRKRSIIKKLVLLLPLVVVGIVFIANSISDLNDIRTFDVKDTAYTDFLGGEAYYFSEMTLIDLVTSGYELTSDIETPDTYLVSFRDKNGELCYSYISVSYRDDIEDICYEYMMDETKVPGDVTLSGCFVGYKAELSDYLVQEYISEFPGKTVNMRFYYKTKSAQEYVDGRKSEAERPMIPGIILLLLSALFAVLIIKKSDSTKVNVADAPASADSTLNKYTKGRNNKKTFLIILCVSAVLFVLGIVGVIADVEEITAAYIFGIIGCVAGGVLYYKARKEAALRKTIEERFPTEEALNAELERAYYIDGEFRCTPHLLVFPNGKIVPKNMIVWMFIRKRKSYFITVGRSVVIKTVDCKEIEISLNDAEDEAKFTNMLMNVIQTLPPNLILGYSSESMKKYREYKKQYKNNK